MLREDESADPMTARGAGGLDVQRSRAWAGRHLHRTAFGLVQVCSPEALARSHRQIGLFRDFGFYPFRERVSSLQLPVSPGGDDVLYRVISFAGRCREPLASMIGKQYLRKKMFQLWM